MRPRAHDATVAYCIGCHIADAFFYSLEIICSLSCIECHWCSIGVIQYLAGMESLLVVFYILVGYWMARAPRILDIIIPYAFPLKSAKEGTDRIPIQDAADDEAKHGRNAQHFVDGGHVDQCPHCQHQYHDFEDLLISAEPVDRVELPLVEPKHSLSSKPLPLRPGSGELVEAVEQLSRSLITDKRDRRIFNLAAFLVIHHIYEK